MFTYRLDIILLMYFNDKYYYKPYFAIFAISYPASIVPLPADTAAVSMSLGRPVALPSAS